jgi:hypothetical protein
MRALAATYVCLAALATCSAAVAAPPAQLQHSAPYEFVLLYERSGGFAPGTRGLMVAPAQFATAESSGPGAGKRRVDFHLGSRRIRALERGLRRAHFSSLESPGASGCADCFEYSIFYRGHNLALDESQMPKALGRVIEQIEAIISAHTDPPKA